MKNKFTKIISTILIVTLLVSMCSIFAFADESDGGAVGSNELVHMLNRNFGEGWDVDNGLKVTANSNKFFIDSEEASDYSYNYFARFEAVNVSEAYAEVNFKTAGQIQNENGSVIKFSIKVDRQLYTGNSEFQRIDVFDSKEFGRFLTLDGYMMLTEKDEFIYHEMITHDPVAVQISSLDSLSS